LNWPIERFPAFSWLAWKYTEKREFLDEFNRLLNLDDVRNKIPFGRSWKEITDVLETREPYFDFERKSALRTFSFMPENSESGFLSLEPMLKYGAPEQKLWLNKTKEMFERDKQALFEEGSVNTKMLYDRKTGKITSVKNVINFPENSAAWLSKVYGFVGEVKSAMQSIMFARAATGMYEYLEDVEMLKISAKILKEAKLRELYWRNSEQYPEDLQWMNKVFSGDAATHWLWAYWEGATKYGIDWITEYTEDKKSANIKATIMS
jgi:hypothetical protein